MSRCFAKMNQNSSLTRSVGGEKFCHCFYFIFRNVPECNRSIIFIFYLFCHSDSWSWGSFKIDVHQTAINKTMIVWYSAVVVGVTCYVWFWMLFLNKLTFYVTFSPPHINCIASSYIISYLIFIFGLDFWNWFKSSIAWVLGVGSGEIPLSTESSKYFYSSIQFSQWVFNWVFNLFFIYDIIISKSNSFHKPWNLQTYQQVLCWLKSYLSLDGIKSWRGCGG